MLPVKILLLIVGLVDATGFIGLCFWKGEPFTYFVIIAVTAGMGFTGGVFESIIPSKSKNRHHKPNFGHFWPTSASLIQNRAFSAINADGSSANLAQLRPFLPSFGHFDSKSATLGENSLASYRPL